MICVSIGESTIESCLTALKDVNFAEIRLDKIKDLTMEGLKEIINMNKRLLITFRPGNIDESLRIQYLSRAIELGVNYLDIEIESEEKTIKSLNEKAEKFNTKLIVSYHNYKETPPLDDLLKIVEKAKKLGASLVKIATYVNEKEDNFKLIRVLEKEQGTIIIGMGNMGKISRIMSVILGSPFTFASLSEDKNTADGQIEYLKMKKIIEDIS